MSVQSIENYEAGIRACCMPETPLLSAAQRIAALDVNALAVLDRSGAVAGILTDHDIIRQLVKSEGRLDDVSVGDCMSTPVITCEINTSLGEALRLMGQNGIRHLIVTRAAAFVRIFSLKDLLEKIHQDDVLEAEILRELAIGRSVPGV
ncbi:CBS domain-containing protein [Tropicimonas sp. TH_r6]|uniref:CBS domain-containing protein n=1 Tax=Tropicimonas sp. TH_r6 TaxID=3082085 RepID=UPI0029554E34|nr:CBS domain-containing protein [Tropicimonas sp. TH_r6]MDV7142802.1 CBS domain-containing protein [Tropicimonas sp. TH_r6]